MRIALPALVSLWALKSAEAIIVGKQYYDSTLPCAMSLDSIPDCNKYPRNECCKSPELKNLILPFNTTRVPSSDGSAKVRKHIIDHFEGLKQNWKQEIVTSQERGYNFTNIIYSLEVDDHTEDQDSDNKFLMLSAHYDSKIKPDGFIGAIDSAAPCAMLLYAAQFIDHIWGKGELSLQSGLSFNKGIKIVFFDGEEAFEQWSETDSLYGSRAVAKQFKENGIMEKIDLMVLLDLLGSAEPIQIPNFYQETANYYDLFWAIESQYNEEYTKQVSNNHTTKNFFDPNIKPHATVQDDHLPFLAHNVPVLHLIPSPFPSTWHTLNDNYDNLDTEVIHKWSILVCEFLLRYYFVN